MNEHLIPVKAESDILPEWRGTAISDLLTYHNLGRPHRPYSHPSLLVVMCMDYRKALRIPDGFAYVLRNGGGKADRVQFEIAFAVSVGGIRALALIAHDDCRMSGLRSYRDAFVQGLSGEGWRSKDAEEYFDAHAPLFEIADGLELVSDEANRLRMRYPSVTVAPLFYSVKDRLLYQVRTPTDGRTARHRKPTSSRPAQPESTAP